MFCSFSGNVGYYVRDALPTSPYRHMQACCTRLVFGRASSAAYARRASSHAARACGVMRARVVSVPYATTPRGIAAADVVRCRTRSPRVDKDERLPATRGDEHHLNKHEILRADPRKDKGRSAQAHERQEQERINCVRAAPEIKGDCFADDKCRACRHRRRVGR